MLSTKLVFGALSYLSIVGLVRSSTSRNKVTVRLLQASSWRECLDEEYRVLLFVDTHISLVGVLDRSHDGDSDHDKTCGSFLFHDGGEGKEAVEPDGEELRKYQDEGLLLGTFPWRELVEAFENASESGQAYDVVRSNCATVVLNIMAGLGLQANADVVKYTASKLYENGKTVTSLRGSLHLSEM